ncbi:MAG: IS481 family transposase, partial [Verrucomicrobiota bacterium]
RMDQRIEFAMKAVNCSNFRGLCREYGISPKTGYKWRERFIESGVEGMAEQSRRPRSHAKELTEKVVCRIVALKNAHPHWGPRKIRDLYRRKYNEKLPSESSFKRVLERAGLTTPRKVRRVAEGGRISNPTAACSPNEVWTVDFKGWWYSSAGDKVEPLTVRDEYSRMLLEMRAMENSRTETVRACFEKLFSAHGLPKMIRSDNGPPFASAHALMGLSRLSVWWLALGIDLARGRPGCPQDNGAHERMHLDIKNELQAGRIGRDQEAFDLWRHEFNNERPHESLAMALPAEVYQPSGRAYKGTPDELDYGDKETRRVTKAGTVRYSGECINLSTTLQGWDVALVPKDDVEVEIWFTHLLLGHWNIQTSNFKALRERG